MPVTDELERYHQVSYELSRRLTLRYSTSFGLSSRLFDAKIRPHIYAIYGLVRVADEIVDSYQGPKQGDILSDLEKDTILAMQTGYSANVIVHCFVQTARMFKIPEEDIKAFFWSMRLDISKSQYDQAGYEKYIYGSAEVIGLMCLRVFLGPDNDSEYQALAPGAQRLGSAYQKINFLRDMAADYQERGRVYFPDASFDTINQSMKQQLTDDMRADLSIAKQSVDALPYSARSAVRLSYRLYEQLLQQLERADITEIKQRRLRVSNVIKFRFLAVELVRKALRR